MKGREIEVYYVVVCKDGHVIYPHSGPHLDSAEADISRDKYNREHPHGKCYAVTAKHQLEVELCES